MKSIYSLPDKDINRSSMTLKHRNLMTMSSGLLYPIYLEEFLPGDTFSIDVSTLARMATPIHPVMDDCFMDIYFFSVPNRLTWEHWEEFIGQKEDDPFVEGSAEYTVPQLKTAYDASGPIREARRIPYKSLMDYFGLPAGEAVKSFSALPFRAYGLIWNEWFRAQELQNPIDVDISDSDSTYYKTPARESEVLSYDINSDDYVTTAQIGGHLAPVAKFHDLFTSATIAPQHGAEVPIPLAGFAPVYTSSILNSPDYILPEDSIPLQLDANRGGLRQVGVVSGSNIVSSGGFDVDQYGASLNATGANLSEATKLSKALGIEYSTINDLRFSFAIQSLLENDLYGTRYVELIKSHFGVTAPMGLLQKPEFLGHKKIPITMSQVLQTSSTDSTSPQGNASGFSMTKDYSSYFSKSFVEHGYVIGLACIRTTKSYSQGVDKIWSHKDRLDFYWPELANIPNQPILQKEVYNGTIGTTGEEPNIIVDPANEDVFGYGEAWYEYRYKLNKFCGEFRSNYPQSLDSWHYGDDYETRPYLSDSWIREDRNNIDRTIAVDSDVADQFICDFYFINKCARPLPVYSIPGIGRHF